MIQSNYSVLTWAALFHITFCEVVEVGNTWTRSQESLTNVRRLTFLLVDFSLVDGTLREFRLTTTDSIAPLRLQVWRPLAINRAINVNTTTMESGPRYRLLFESKYFSDDRANHSLYPGDGVRVQKGDVLGFMSESENSGIVYNFRPLGFGARVRTRSFSSLPFEMGAYTFDAIAYDTWVFAFSALIDTNFGVGPLDGGVKPTSSTVVTIGNPLIDGHILRDSLGTLIMAEDRLGLPRGIVTTLEIHSSVINSTIWLQIWRPNEDKTNLHKLIDERRYTTQGIGIETVRFSYPMLVSARDRIGFTSYSSSFPIAYNEVPTGSNVLYRHLEDGGQTSKPSLGNTYFFNQTLLNHTFSFVVFVNTDTSKHRNPLIRPGPMTVSKPGMTRREAVLLALILFIFLAIVIISNLYALWFILSKNRRVDLVDKATKPVVMNSAPEWSIPRSNIYLYEHICDCHGGSFMKAEVYGVSTKQGWTTASVRTIKETTSNQEKHSFLREMEVLRSIKSHANVLQLLGCCVEKEPMMMAMEAVPFGSLLDYLRDLRHTHMHMNIAGHSNFTITMDLISFAGQVARGMAHLASLRVLHKDLAARSVFLGEGKLCKISFFSYAQDVVEYRQHKRAIKSRMPVRWMALESLVSNIYTTKSDVWSFGILLWEIVTLGATPYYELNSHKVIRDIKRGLRLDQPPHCRTELYETMTSCWSAKAHDRPSFEDLSQKLQVLHDQNTDLLQLEKYPEGEYQYLLSAPDLEEIV